MDTNEDPKADSRASNTAGAKVKMVIGSIAVLAITLLAGLVFTQYEAGIPPENAPTEYMHVSISAQSLADKSESVPAHA